MRGFRVGLMLVMATLPVFVIAAAASATGTAITEPSANPYHVALQTNGAPVPFTVVASGYPLRAAVFVQICNGRAPSDPNWSPTTDCDVATGQAAAYADAKGMVRFPANDSSLALRPFSGPSPQGLFNCLPPGAKSPNNGLADFHQCQIRVATNPVRAVKDQTFLPIVLGTGSSGTSSSSTGVWLIVVLGLVLLAIVVGLALRSRSRTAAPKAKPSRGRR